MIGQRCMIPRDSLPVRRATDPFSDPVSHVLMRRFAILLASLPALGYGLLRYNAAGTKVLPDPPRPPRCRSNGFSLYYGRPS